MNSTQVTPIEPAKMLDSRGVAKMLGVSARHVERLSSQGRLPKPIRLGTCVRWSISSIQSWIDNGGPSSTDQERGNDA